MSYDIYLRPLVEKCEHCGRSYGEADCPNPTYNLAMIFHLALTGEPFPSPNIGIFSEIILGQKPDRPRGLCVLSGMTAKESEPMLAQALQRLIDPAQEAGFRALEPENKWGTLEDAVFVIKRLLELAIAYPEDRWTVR